jgi:hypothetical protein
MPAEMVETSPPAPEIDRSDPLLLDLVTYGGTSMRLRNCIANEAAAGTLAYPRVSDFVAAGADADLYFLRRPNFGRKILNELRGLVEAVQRTPLEIPPKEPAVAGSAACDEFPPYTGLEDLLRFLLARLDDRRRDVIECRFGLSGERQSLDQVASAHNTTRVRIRSAEARALRLLRHRAKDHLMVALFDAGCDIWAVLSTGGVVHASELHIRRGTLSPWFNLALAVCGWTLEHWLDEYARADALGWCLQSANASDLPPDSPPTPATEVGRTVDADYGPVRAERIYRWATRPASNVHRIIAIAADHCPVARGWLVDEIGRLGISTNPYGAIASLMTNGGNAYGRIFVEEGGLLRFHPDVGSVIAQFEWARS